MAGALVLGAVWYSTKGLDWIPDFLQSDVELLCQRCENQLNSGNWFSTANYQRHFCDDYRSEEVDIDALIQWAQTPESEHEFMRFTQRFIEIADPDGAKLTMESVRLGYSFEVLGEVNRVSLTCSIMRRKDGILLETYRHSPFGSTVAMSGAAAF